MQFVTLLCIILNGSKYIHDKPSLIFFNLPPLSLFFYLTNHLIDIFMIVMFFFVVLCFNIFVKFCLSSCFVAGVLLWKFIIVIKGLPFLLLSLSLTLLINHSQNIYIHLFSKSIEWKIWDMLFKSMNIVFNQRTKLLLAYAFLWNLIINFLRISGWQNYYADNGRNKSLNSTKMDKYLYNYNHTTSKANHYLKLIIKDSSTNIYLFFRKIFESLNLWKKTWTLFPVNKCFSFSDFLFCKLM